MKIHPVVLVLAEKKHQRSFANAGRNNIIVRAGALGVPRGGADVAQRGSSQAEVGDLAGQYDDLFRKMQPWGTAGGGTTQPSDEERFQVAALNI